jgi:hypothetical protein
MWHELFTGFYVKLGWKRNGVTYICDRSDEINVCEFVGNNWCFGWKFAELFLYLDWGLQMETSGVYRVNSFFRKIQKMYFTPINWVNRKTNGTIRKCFPRGFQWMVMSGGFDNLKWFGQFQCQKSPSVLRVLNKFSVLFDVLFKVNQKGITKRTRCRKYRN